jgi:PHD/YefM family antitoxin component YafN of YafNO toxin-antitoxin module
MTLVAFKREMHEETLQLLSNDVAAEKFGDMLTKQ